MLLIDYLSNSIKILNKKKLALACALAITACSDGTQNNLAQSLQHAKQAEAYSEQGQFRPAIIEARNAIQKAPQEAQGHILLANIFVKLGQSSQAIAQLNQVPDAARNELPYILVKAEAFISSGKFKSAQEILNSPLTTNSPEAILLKAKSMQGLEHLDQAIALYNELPTSNVDAQLGLAKVYAQQNEFHKSFALLSALKENTPPNPEVTLFEASLAARDGNLSQTEALLTSALSALPASDIMTPLKASVLRGLADVLTKQGRSSEALIYTRILSEAFPGAEIAQSSYNEAVTLFQQGKLDQAKQKLLDLLKDYPQFGQGSQLIGVISFLQGDFESANDYFNDNLDPEVAPQQITNVAARTSLELNQPEKVLAMLEGQISDTKNPDTLALYGLAAISAGKGPEAESALLRSLEIKPDNSRLRLALAEYYSNNHNEAAALKQTQIAFETGATDPLVQAQLAKQLLDAGKTEEANQLLKKLINDNPDQYTTYLVAGDAQFYQGNYTQAISHYRKAMQLAPDNLAAMSSYAMASQQAKEWEQAASAYEKLAAANPDRLSGFRGIIQTYSAMNKVEEGLALVNSQKSETESIQPYIALAEHFTRMKDFESAEKEVNAAREKMPDTPLIKRTAALVKYYEAIALIANEQLDDAKAAALAGLQEEPNNQQLLTTLIESEIKLGDYSSARELALQLKDHNPAIYYLLAGEIELAQQKQDTGLANYQKSWDLKPTDIAARRIFSLIAARQGKVEAEKFLKEWHKAIPNSPNALAILADFALKEESYTAAIGYLEHIQKVAPPSPVLLNNLAWAYFKTGNNKAVDAAKLAYQGDQNNPAILDTYGWILVNSNQVQKGIGYLEQAAKLAPSIDEIQQHLIAARKMR